jgi:glycosyltransferase involved in cell wall biosynthesis
MKSVQARLLLIGAGPEEQNLQNMVERNNLNEKVHFLGELPDDDVNIYYKACDIFVLPSQLRSEAFGMVQLEAMCCGKPVISTELGTGTSFVNLDQQTGIVVKPNDSQSLSKALSILINNPIKRRTLGACGSKRVRQMFTAKQMVNSTLKLYEDVIAKSEKPALKSGNANKSNMHKINKNYKILRVVSRLNIGGPSIHCAILTKGLSKTHFNVKLLIGKISPYEGDMSYLINGADSFLLKVPELQREINIISDISAFYKIIKIIFKEHPDIVHTHLAKAGAISRAAVFIHNLVSHKKIKTVHTFHGNVLDGYFTPQATSIFIGIEKVLAKLTDAIIAISQTQKWELTEKFKIADKDKVHIINLGFDLTRFTKNNGQKKLRSQLGVENRTLLIGIVGRLVPIKNHILFLDSAKLILKNNPEKNILFLVIGDGELREHLELYVKKIDIEDYVVFYGWENEIEDIYAGLDMLLLTSNNEGTPVSIIESMASCVPVVTTGVGGVKDLLGQIKKKTIGNNEYSICERGILCPKGNADSIAGGVQYLITNDNDILVKEARDFVMKNYTDVRLIERITKLYQTL